MSGRLQGACTLRGKGHRQCVVRRRTPLRTVTKSLSDVNLIVSACTAGSLALGRLGVLPIHRAFLARQGKPKQNGETHEEAGDVRSKEVSIAQNTNDPAGFTIIDVMAWGAIGHAVAFYLLATSSLNATGASPVPF